MGSILSSNPSTDPQAVPAVRQDPVASIKNIANQILNSANPQQAFQQVLDNSTEARNTMDLINQYGNGDPKAAFQNYAVATGKQNLAQKIRQMLGLE